MEVYLPSRETPSVHALTEELREHLTEAAKEFDQSEDADRRRDAALQQLMRIASYLPHMGIPHELLRPTTAIIHALIDIDRGAVPQIFKRQRC